MPPTRGIPLVPIWIISLSNSQGAAIRVTMTVQCPQDLTLNTIFRCDCRDYASMNAQVKGTLARESAAQTEFFHLL